jgi:REase_MTES_1575/AAA domain
MIGEPSPEVTTHEDELRLAKAINLFEFLARAQELRTTPVRTTESYERDGAVIWLGDRAAHPAIECVTQRGDPELEAGVLTVPRIPRLEPPAPPHELRPWLDGDLDNPHTAVSLRDELPADRALRGEFITEVIEIDAVAPLWANPDVQRCFDDWMSRWRTWAEQQLIDEPVQVLYGQLFAIHIQVAAHPEEFELIAGTGCLAWEPRDAEAVRRHMLTTPVAIRFDDDTGQLSVVVAPSQEPISVELDMLEPQLLSDPGRINAIKADAREFAAHPLHRDHIGAIARRLVHTLDPSGRYDESDEPPDSGQNAIAAFAPAIILRKRSQQALVEIYRTIVDQLRSTNDVPEGILPLVDPDYLPSARLDPTPGGIVMIEEDAFLPLRVNDAQLRIIRNVDSHAQTVVQGPPGTGKTHTAAALISHLLAQGKRVLVAAHTDRALKEVRAKLPPAIKPLSVAVVGTSREDMSSLKVAVERIAAAASDYDAEHSQNEIEDALARIDELKGARSRAYRELLESRKQEVVKRTHRGYHGTLAAIAKQYQADADEYAWLTRFALVPADAPAPLTNAEALEWLRLVRDELLNADEAEAGNRLLALEETPRPLEFARLCEQERIAGEAMQRHRDVSAHDAFAQIRALGPDDRDHLRLRMRDLAREAGELEQRHESWMNDALADVRSGRLDTWQSRAAQIEKLINHAGPLVGTLGALTEVRIQSGDLGKVEALAQSLLAYVQGGGRVKTAPDGSPKIGALTPKTVKQAAALFEQARVNGHPPTTDDQLGAVLTFIKARRTLEALERAWPADVPIPREDTLRERVNWHMTEVRQLHRVLVLGSRLEQEERLLRSHGIAKPDWNDLAAVLAYARMVDAAVAEEQLIRAAQPLQTLEEAAESAASWSDAAPCVHGLHLAVRTREHNQYASAYARLERLHTVRHLSGQRDALGLRLRVAAPDLERAIASAPEDADWPDRLEKLEAAWDWASTGQWILGHEGTDANAIQGRVSIIEDQIRAQVERLAATRAWAYAVSPGRLTGQAHADLQQYAYLVRRLGKGTGKYADKRRTEIRRAMDRCRPAVPVWIMPIYRIAEQLRISPNMFDVVVVDEASQAGLEATFLQYMAPRMVVIGDDKQVSPSAVGVDQQQLRDLANQYLADDRYKASWQDPKRSIFDEAAMRYGSRITLIEHHRCAPEIIEFSNRVAYEPEGIRLIPVRQYGTDRLQPIKTLHTPGGYEVGLTEKVNPVEVEAIADQIAKCLADPRYNDMTFGVISLLGTAHAKAIEKVLMDRIQPDEWTARDLRCGDAADFQGSERNVMFLSMVAAPGPGRRLSVLTQEQYVQRYNVAASRAQDQLWLVHSISVNDVNNAADMRFQLLDYCYGALKPGRSTDDGVIREAVPEDVLVSPFETLFEQRVFNRIIDRGYTAIPRYVVNGYHIDIVIVGAKGRLAVECEGDTWHGPARYERDLAHQRDLERCDWPFYRIRESEFYVDPDATLAGLWQQLAELEIHPAETPPTPDESTLVVSAPAPG